MSSTENNIKNPNKSSFNDHTCTYVEAPAGFCSLSMACLDYRLLGFFLLFQERNFALDTEKEKEEKSALRRVDVICILENATKKKRLIN